VCAPHSLRSRHGLSDMGSFSYVPTRVGSIAAAGWVWSLGVDMWWVGVGWRVLEWRVSGWGRVWCGVGGMANDSVGGRPVVSRRRDGTRH